MLKKLFQLFVESFLKSKKSYISNQAFPSGTFITYTAVRESWQYLTAPCDGFLYVNATETTGVDVSTGTLSILYAPYAGNLSKAVIPARKGDSISYLIHGKIGQGEDNVYFISSVGSA